MVSSYKVQTPRHRSLSTKFIGVSRHGRFPRTRHFRIAATTSCPYLKMSASTTRSSPTMRFIEWRPPSINGCKFSMTTEGKARDLGHQSTEICGQRKNKSISYSGRRKADGPAVRPNHLSDRLRCKMKCALV